MKKKNNNDDPNGDPDSCCNYCGLFDPDFDEDTLMMHQFKECPLVYISFNLVTSMLQMQTNSRNF